MSDVKLNIGKRSEFSDLRTNLIDYLKSFVIYNNENCMFHIGHVYEYESDEIVEFPSISISLPDIDFVDTIGYGEDIECSTLNIIQPINCHICGFEGKEETEDTIQFIDNFIHYLYNNPQIYGSFVFNGTLQVLQNFVFEESNSLGMIILIGLNGMYHR